MILDSWARKWAVPQAALADLRASLLALEGAPPAPQAGRSEAAVQSRVRVAASAAGMRVWRNNIGVFHDPERNIYVRYGLANESPQVNAMLKSADLIGIRPRIVQPQDVGLLIGQFVSFEVKHEGWKWRGDDHEVAQSNWANLVLALGGEARFISHESQV